MIASVFLALLQIPAVFWPHWGDGKAEINRYEGTQIRYGAERKSEQILIYMTEPFNVQLQVKTDKYSAGDESYINVLKFNRIKEFPTGMYNYNLMTSVFTSLEPFEIDDTPFPPSTLMKIAFSEQDWNGLVSQQVNRQVRGMYSSLHSYFEKEADRNELYLLTPQTLFADELFIRVRELTNPLEDGLYHMYPTLEHTRLFHQPVEEDDVTVTHAKSLYTFDGAEIPVKKFLIANNQLEWLFTVESEYPHRILYYRFTRGGQVIEDGKLTGTERLPYWKLHAPGDEAYLHKLKDN
jgi:hypothetical protein